MARIILGLLLMLQATTLLADSPPAASSVSFTRLYTDAKGVSHFTSETLPLAAVAGGQGMEANLAVHRIGDVQGVLFAQLKAGATEDWHIAPRRQFMVCVRGIVEITASDGQKRRLRPGQFMLLEDTTGKGHITHATGAEDHVALAVPVPDGVLARK
jgi:quercetin dioxygenase-like cupin family protein